MVKAGINQACARCKYQRRKCTSECVLAPFFPPDQPKNFQNAHKLFGVSNILKILRGLDENQRVEAMRSIIHESNIRHKFPVHGCLGVILQYQYEIQEMEEELHFVQKQLALHQQQSSQNHLSRMPTQNALGLFETPPKCINPIVTWPIDSDPSYSCNDDAIISVDQNGTSNKSIKKNDHNDDNNNQVVLQKQLLGLDIQQDVVDQDYEFLDTI